MPAATVRQVAEGIGPRLARALAPAPSAQEGPEGLPLLAVGHSEGAFYAAELAAVDVQAHVGHHAQSQRLGLHLGALRRVEGLAQHPRDVRGDARERASVVSSVSHRPDVIAANRAAQRRSAGRFRSYI